MRVSARIASIALGLLLAGSIPTALAQEGDSEAAIRKLFADLARATNKDDAASA